MSWHFTDDRPIYSQLIDQIKIKIITGVYPCGSRLPSVRDMATEAEVNPNTMQKALSELEKDNLVFSQRTSGRFITEDINMIENLKLNLAAEQINGFFNQMEKLGYTKKQAIDLIEKLIKEKN